MLERTGWGASRHGRLASRVTRCRKLVLDPLEGRALMAAALAPIANITAPAALGYQVPLDGTGGGASQTYTVTSSNPDVKATIAQGEFLTLNVNHVSSGASDPAFSGSLTFQLFSDVAPTAVAAIEQLVTSGFYTNSSNDADQIFRVASGFPDANGFIAQTGAVNVNDGEGTDTPPAPGAAGGLPTTGFPFQNEFSQSVAFTNPGQLALANAGFTQSDINSGDFFTNSSQFFITNSTPRSLDFGYTIFGQLVAQSDPNLLNELMHVMVTTNGAGEDSLPLGATTVTSATLSPTSPDGVVHVDTTGATAGETSTVNVTAFDPSTNTTTAQSFVVTVGPTNASPGPTEKPFLNVFPSVNTPITTAINQPAVFQVQGISPGSPTDPLSYTVAGSTSSTSTGTTFNPIPASEGTATVSANGLVTVTPAPGFTGNITVLVGVQDQTDRTGKGLSDVSNFDVKQFTVSVSGSTPVNRPPIASPVSVTASSGAPVQVQLHAVSGTTGTSANLTYAIATQPAHGTLSNLNATAGTVTYTPAANFLGPDSFTYTATDTGITPNLTSTPATVSITVGTGVTGAVRVISDGDGDSVLVVTPPPNKKRQQDQVAVFENASGNIQVEVNGVIDSTQPAASSLTQIVIYGSKTGTSTVVAPNVDIPVSLDTGHGGTNFINNAGSANSTINSWFGHSAVQGGSASNAIVGRKNHLLKVVKSPGTDSVFLSHIDPYNRVPHWKVAGFHGKKVNVGAFYKFVGKKLVKTAQPASAPLKPNGG